jgi:hypothetical protein
LFEKTEEVVKEDPDFFEHNHGGGGDAPAAAAPFAPLAGSTLSKPSGELSASLSGGGAAAAEKKPASSLLKGKKPGLGKKKVGGLGGVKKVSKNFDEIEKKVGGA